MLLTHRDAAVLSMTLRSLLQDKLESKAVIGCHSHGKGPQVDATVGVGVTFGGNCCSSMLNCGSVETFAPLLELAYVRSFLGGDDISTRCCGYEPGSKYMRLRPRSHSRNSACLIWQIFLT